MASNSDPQDETSNKEAVASQTPHNNQSPPPQATSYPPATGYPPPMGYPPGQPGYPPPGYHYPGYANGGYPNYAYSSQAPPVAYYNNRMYQPARQDGYNPAGFARGFVLGLFLLIFFLFTSNITMWLFLRPELPVFHLDGFSVSNFNASWPTLTADWEANITVRNPNSKIKVYSDQIHNIILYGEDKLCTSVSPPIYLDIHQSTGDNLKLAANSTDAIMAGKLVVDKMAAERNKGTVNFNLRMGYWTTFKSGTWYVRKVILKVYCEQIKVAFVGASGNGKASAESLGDCLIVS